MRIGRIVAQQVEYATTLEGWRTAVVLLQCRAAKGVEQDFQGGVGAYFVECLALVLEDFFARHVLGIQDAAFGGAMHVFHQVTRQRAGQQRVLLLDERSGCCVGQVFDGFTPQDRQSDEVRNLAKRVQASTDEITTMVSALQAGTRPAHRTSREDRSVEAEGIEQCEVELDEEVLGQ